MKNVRLINDTRGRVLCERCRVADNIFTRVRGLLGRSTLEAGEGLLIAPCPSIHMFGMKFALDVIFIARDNTITDYVENILPGKLYVAQSHFGKAHAALEVVPGTIAATGTERGDKVRLESHV